MVSASVKLNPFPTLWSTVLARITHRLAGLDDLAVTAISSEEGVGSSEE